MKRKERKGRREEQREKGRQEGEKRRKLRPAFCGPGLAHLLTSNQAFKHGAGNKAAIRQGQSRRRKWFE